LSNAIRNYQFDDIPIPESIDAKDPGGTIPAKDFPITPVEAWLILRGYHVKPRQGINVETLLNAPGRMELADGYVCLKK
jgi:hypothetical protein